MPKWQKYTLALHAYNLKNGFEYEGGDFPQLEENKAEGKKDTQLPPEWSARHPKKAAFKYTNAKKPNQEFIFKVSTPEGLA